MTVQYRIASIFLDEDVSSRNLSSGSSAETGSNLQKHVLVSKNFHILFDVRLIFIFKVK